MVGNANGGSICSANSDYLDRNVDYSLNNEYASVFTPREGVEGEVTSKSVMYRAEVCCVSVASFVFTHLSDMLPKTSQSDSKETEAPRPLLNESDDHTLVLVGRKDGSVDLFSLNYEFPLYTWDLLSLDDSSNGSSKKKEKDSDAGLLRETIAVKWCSPTNSTSFFAVDSCGIVYFFDLSISFDRPCAIDRNITDLKKYTKTNAFKKQFKFHKSNSSILYSGRHILSNLIDISCESNVESQTAFMTVSDPVSISNKTKSDPSIVPPASAVKTRQLSRDIYPLVTGKYEKSAAQKLSLFKALLDFHSGSSTHSSSQVTFQRGGNGDRK